MTDLNEPFAPASDVRHALFADIQQFLSRDEHPPPTIGELAKGDTVWSSTAQNLIDAVGSAANVQDLDEQPHHDDGFDWAGIAASDRARIGEIATLLSSDLPVPRADGTASTFEMFDLAKVRTRLLWCDPEYRTIGLRILRALAVDTARPLDRRIKPERIAAAIMWIAITASNGFARSQRLKPPQLWDWFEVSSCTKLARQLASHVRRYNASISDTNEVDLRDNEIALAELTLGDAAMLHSTYRTLVLDCRNDLLERVENEREQIRSDHPIIVNGPKYPIGFRSRPVTVRWAMRGSNEESNRAAVSVAFGEGLDDIEVLALSITDARRLIDALQHALDAPIAA